MDKHDDANQAPEEAASTTPENDSIDNNHPSSNKNWEVRYDADVAHHRARIPYTPDVIINNTGYISIQIGDKKDVYKTYSKQGTRGTQISINDEYFKVNRSGKVLVQPISESQFRTFLIFHTFDGKICLALLLAGVVGFGIQFFFFMGTKFPQHAIEVSTEVAFSALTASIFLKVMGFSLLFLQAIKKL
ncbi:hypothetical protein [Aliiglaciecola litoralis]|uniref:Uncharacterized protein n=1 Tax=Aliiglaciecola litoralis TaxID=582857 RepID=A0ABN1LQI4_9ALTE